MTYKQRAFINYVKRTRPRTAEDLQPRYRVSYLDSGAFRQTFEILGLGLVIKFPGFLNPRRDNLYHAQCEARVVRCMKHNPKLVTLKRYAPMILHHDRGRGVTIMPKYRKVKYSQAFKGFRDTFEDMLVDLIPSMRYIFDGGVCNFGCDERGHYILLDAGLLGEKYERTRIREWAQAHPEYDSLQQEN